MSDDPEHEALRYWRDRRGVLSQAGLAVRTDLLNELIDSSSRDGDSFFVAFIKLAKVVRVPQTPGSTVLIWEDIDWDKSGGYAFEEIVKNEIKPYGYSFMRIRPSSGDTVNSHGTALNPFFRPENVMMLRPVTVMPRIL